MLDGQHHPIGLINGDPQAGWSTSRPMLASQRHALPRRRLTTPYGRLSKPDCSSCGVTWAVSCALDR